MNAPAAERYNPLLPMNQKLTELVIRITTEKDAGKKLGLIEDLKELLDQEASQLKIKTQKTTSD